MTDVKVFNPFADYLGFDNVLSNNIKVPCPILGRNKPTVPSIAESFMEEGEHRSLIDLPSPSDLCTDDVFGLSLSASSWQSFPPPSLQGNGRCGSITSNEEDGWSPVGEDINENPFSFPQRGQSPPGNFWNRSRLSSSASQTSWESRQSSPCRGVYNMPSIPTAAMPIPTSTWSNDSRGPLKFGADSWVGRPEPRSLWSSGSPASLVPDSNAGWTDLGLPKSNSSSGSQSTLVPDSSGGRPEPRLPWSTGSSASAVKPESSVSWSSGNSGQSLMVSDSRVGSSESRFVWSNGNSLLPASKSTEERPERRMARSAWSPPTNVRSSTSSSQYSSPDHSQHRYSNGNLYHSSMGSTTMRDHEMIPVAGSVLTPGFSSTGFYHQMNGTVASGGNNTDMWVNNGSPPTSNQIAVMGASNLSSVSLEEMSYFLQELQQIQAAREILKLSSSHHSNRWSLDEGKFCALCKRNGETREFYSTHVVKDSRGKVICPILRKYKCPLCGATGDHAHTIGHCPYKRSK